MTAFCSPVYEESRSPVPHSIILQARVHHMGYLRLDWKAAWYLERKVQSYVSQSEFLFCSFTMSDTIDQQFP